jgi:hypothetical protein
LSDFNANWNGRAIFSDLARMKIFLALSEMLQEEGRGAAYRRRAFLQTFLAKAHCVFCEMGIQLLIII